jgi:hypothetical protein
METGKQRERERERERREERERDQSSNIPFKGTPPSELISLH